ncbi:structural molecule activity [Sparganum proliferum]
MLMDAYRDERPGIRIAYGIDGHLLSSRRMQASTRLSTISIHDLLFDDDCTLNTETEADMQRSMELFASESAADQPENLGRPHKESAVPEKSSKTGAVIREANRITAAKAKQGVSKSQTPLTRNANLNLSQYVHAVKEHSVRELALLDIRGLNAPARQPQPTATALTADAQHPRAQPPSVIAISIIREVTSAETTETTTTPTPTTEHNSPDGLLAHL